MNLTVAFTPEARAALSQLQNAPTRTLRAIAHALDIENELTIGYAQQNKLSGPRPEILGVVTNRLRSSIRRSDATISGSQVDSGLGSNVKYAGAHEYGFEGDVQVRSFTRRVRKDQGVGRRAKFTRSTVKSFTRHMRVRERSFMRSSISERLANYNASLSAAVLDALGGTT